MQTATTNTPTAESARRIAAHVFGGEPVEPVRYLGEGLVNRVFGVRLPDGDFAIRLCKEGSDSSVCEQECRFLRHAALCGVPVPWVRAWGVWAGQPYLIQSLAPGVQSDLTGSDLGFCWHRLGQYARRLHDIVDGPASAHLTAQERHQYTDEARAIWQRFITYNLDSLTPDDPLLALGVYHAGQRDVIADVFHRLQDETFRFGLCHNDLAPRHLWVTPDEQTTLLDWGSAEINLVPHYDLLEILRHQSPHGLNVTTFRAGYGLTDADFTALLPQVLRLHLLKDFDLVRWAIDRRPQEILIYAERARATRLAMLSDA